MKYKFFLLLFCLILIPVVSGQFIPPYQVSPNSLEIIVNQNEYVTKNISITSNLNYSRNISIQSDLPVLFSDTNFEILNETVNVSLHFFGEETCSGLITVSDDDGVIQNIPVIITLIESESDEDSYEDSLVFEMFPENPVSGNYFAVSFNESFNSSGFLWIKEQMIPVSVENGFVILKVDKNMFGEARLWLHTYGFVAEFMIKSGLEGSPSLKIPKSSEINDVVNVQFVIGGEPISDEEIEVTSPSDDVSTYITDVEGRIYPILDEVGEWIFKSEFQGKKIVQKLNIPYLKMDVSISKKVFNIGEKVGIVTDVNNAVITIKKENSVKLQINVGNGYLEYTPDESGTYTVSVISDDETKKGSNSFDVKVKATISVFDKNNMQTSFLKQNHEYLIKIIDDSGNVISDYSKVMIDLKQINLNNGIGFWSPSSFGELTLSIDSKGQYIGSQSVVTVEQSVIKNDELDNTIIYILIACISVPLIIIMLYHFYNRGIISIPDELKNLFNRDKKIPDDLF
ncbi:MAG: hypothetical protein KGY67_00435 [Candidatus Thermoplasmatota archaeon]|nr:hypothetical protein [Candidatus Thermoplasmatota archaeon]